MSLVSNCKILGTLHFLVALFFSSSNYFIILFAVWILERGPAILCSIVMLCTAMLPGLLGSRVG